MSRKIAIIGGGISGICSAYFLYKSGHEVSIFDANEIGVECSYGNAGLIVPSHFETLSSPGILKKGLKWMINPNSPFFLKPRFDFDLLKWIIKFNSFCTTKHVDKNKHFLRDINLYSLDLYNSLNECSDFDFDLKHSGLLMLCKEEKTLNEESELVTEAKKLGLDAEILNKDELKALEPNASFDVIGASYFKDDSKIQPYDFIIAIKNYLEKNGVKFYEKCKICDVEISNGKIESIIDSRNESYSFDDFIFTTGILTTQIAKMFSLNLPMQGGKGFSFTYEKNDALNFSTPMILAEQKVAVTPYDSYVRFGGTMMIDGFDLSINQRRINNIRKAANSYIDGLNIGESSMQDIWAGLRPCSPDGIPFIGRSDKLSNLIIATGHAMMGISLGPATGKIVSDLIDERKPEIEIERMNLSRFT